jgi:hypothetical protein
MTEHNLGKWQHVYDGHGKTFTVVKIPAIPVIESTTMDSHLFLSPANRKLRVLYDPNDQANPTET